MHPLTPPPAEWADRSCGNGVGVITTPIATGALFCQIPHLRTKLWVENLTRAHQLLLNRMNGNSELASSAIP